jgi:hypothetical protein
MPLLNLTKTNTEHCEIIKLPTIARFIVLFIRTK